MKLEPVYLVAPPKTEPPRRTGSSRRTLLAALLGSAGLGWLAGARFGSGPADGAVQSGPARSNTSRPSEIEPDIALEWAQDLAAGSASQLLAKRHAFLQVVLERPDDFESLRSGVDRLLHTLETETTVDPPLRAELRQVFDSLATRVDEDLRRRATRIFAESK